MALELKVKEEKHLLNASAQEFMSLFIVRFGIALVPQALHESGGWQRKCTISTFEQNGIGEYHMRQVVIYPGVDGFWVAECPSLPGCLSQGATKEEAITNIKEAIE